MDTHMYSGRSKDRRAGEPYGGELPELSGGRGEHTCGQTKGEDAIELSTRTDPQIIQLGWDREVEEEEEEE
ncbi:unnamed protein product, partial [Protopolystoma xenopodis]